MFSRWITGKSSLRVSTGTDTSGPGTALQKPALILTILIGTLPCALTAASTSAAADSTLNIDPIQETQPGESWAPVGEMVMRYYSVPDTGPNDDYQCGLTHYLNGQDVTADCTTPVKLGAYQAALKIISGYQAYAYKYFQEDPVVMRFEQGKVLPADEVIHEIEFERPIVVAIEPPKVSDADKNTKQVALIIGYKGTADHLQIVINDPKVYEIGADPYVDAGASALDSGQYLMNYKDFIREMRWSASIYRIKPQ